MRPILSLLFLSIAAGGLPGCASGTTRTATLLESGAFATAAAAARGDVEETRELAVQILVRAAESTTYRSEALLKLSVSGAAGQRGLTELSARSDALGRAAGIAARRFEVPDEETVSRCVADPSADVRRICAQVFYRVVPASALRKWLTDTDPAVRLFAVKGIAASVDAVSQNWDMAEALARDPSRAVRLEAARHGDLLGEDALLLLARCLKSDAEGMRLAAITGLFRLNTPDAAALLRATAFGPLDAVSLAAAAALSARGDETAQARFLAAFSDDRPGIRVAAMYLSGSAMLPDRMERIAAMLDDRAPSVVVAAAALLGGEDEMHAHILARLKEIADADGADANRALDLAAQLGDSESVATLRALLATVPETEAEALALLRRVYGVRPLFDDVAAWMGDSREAVRVRAAFAVLFSLPKI